MTGEPSAAQDRVSGAAGDPVESLYRDVILEHYRRPHHRSRLATPEATAQVRNPLCGDAVEVEIRLERGRIAELCSRAMGCSIVVAAGSLMGDVACGREPGEVLRMARLLEARIRAEPGVEGAGELDPRLVPLLRIAAAPARQRCALLPWEALCEALGA
ncbi:MAG: Fe-S cluster assembly sulfur transfer protein SufU [Myxococcota bacterium]